jgi:hypothetical protein
MHEEENDWIMCGGGHVESEASVHRVGHRASSASVRVRVGPRQVRGYVVDLVALRSK